MKLALFDVDGTLTQTNEVDGICYEQALAGALGLAGFATDWSLYRHVTDTGIADEACRGCLGRPPAPAELAALKARFLDLLEIERHRQPAAFAPIPGAPEAVRRLAAEPGWAVAVATGGFRESALLKLALAGLDLPGLPLASADDHPERAEILRLAWNRAAAAHGREDFERVVYLGDALWDVRTCAALGLPFIGIGEGPRAVRLRAGGAGHVLADFTDYAALRSALDEATTPAADSHL